MSATVHTVETQQSRASAFIQTLWNPLETCGPTYGIFWCKQLSITKQSVFGVVGQDSVHVAVCLLVLNVVCVESGTRNGLETGRAGLSAELLK